MFLLEIKCLTYHTVFFVMYIISWNDVITDFYNVITGSKAGNACTGPRDIMYTITLENMSNNM